MASSMKNKIAEIERIIERGVSIEEKNGSAAEALRYYETAQTKIKDAFKAIPIDAESQHKLQKYLALITERISINKNPNKKARKTERIFLTGKEFYEKFSSRLRNHDKKLIEDISYNIAQGSAPVNFSDIAGNAMAKSVISESIILPALKPELFTGLRKPAKGILLYGPPGNGKTLLAKAIANQCNSTFFSISAASLMNKYVGESEKLVAALFACARVASPSIIFIDEVDALLANRGDNSNQVQMRLLTQFLQEIDGCQSGEEQLLVLAATNHPEVLDEAALRRLPKRIYIGQPDAEGRQQLLQMLVSKEDRVKFRVSSSELGQIVRSTDGFSSSDLTELVKDAAMGPIRALRPEQILKLSPEDVRPVSYSDFCDSLRRIRPSVNPKSLEAMHEWRAKFGDMVNEGTSSNNQNSSVGRSFFSSFMRQSPPVPSRLPSNEGQEERIVTIRRTLME